MVKFDIALLLEKGRINVKGLLKILRRSEERVDNLETVIGDESSPESILGRIKALEDKG